MLIPLVKRYIYWLIAAVFSGLISGLSTSGLIVFINRAYAKPSAGVNTILWFLLLAASVPIARVLAQTILNYVAQQAAVRLRLQLSRDILACDLRALEETGQDRLMSVLVDDVGTISAGLIAVSMLCMQLAVLVGCLVYLLWLSWTMALVLSTVIVLGMTSVQIIIRRANRYYQFSRKEEDTLFKHLRSVVQGTKELKLHNNRQEAFLTQLLEGSSRRYQQHILKANVHFAIGVGWGNFLFFMLIAGVLFGLTRNASFDRTITSGYMITLLYLMVPLDAIGGLLPSLGRTGVALQNISSLGLSLRSHGREGTGVERLAAAGTIELKGVTFSYDGNDLRNFGVGPIDLTIHTGELVFITGGNGSGKTTLMKLLVGLYRPDKGTILCDGEPITLATEAAYRAQFSTIFSDYHLFDELLGLDPVHLDQEAAKYLEQLELKDKVEVRDGKLSTTNLSQGQRKRLALLTAYLEGRPIYVFDEWAADQDPQFKSVFYHELISDLKRKGRTVVVISHDDQYYHIADRIVKLVDGRIENLEPEFVPDRMSAEPVLRS
jgi:putative ATP-binding cassette transporter